MMQRDKAVSEAQREHIIQSCHSSLEGTIPFYPRSLSVLYMYCVLRLIYFTNFIASVSLVSPLPSPVLSIFVTDLGTLCSGVCILFCVYNTST